MAQLVSRGTLTRGRWDFFENSDYIVYVQGQGTNLQLTNYIQNTATAQVQIDVYQIQWSVSPAVPVDLFLFQPPLQFVTDHTFVKFTTGVQPDNPAPAIGFACVGTITAGAGNRLQSWITAQAQGMVNLSFDAPFLSLPPGWAVGVVCSSTGALTLTTTFFAQQILDLIAPAR